MRIDEGKWGPGQTPSSQAMLDGAPLFFPLQICQIPAERRPGLHQDDPAAGPFIMIVSQSERMPRSASAAPWLNHTVTLACPLAGHGGPGMARMDPRSVGGWRV